MGGEQHQQHDGLRPLRARARRAVAHGGTQKRQSSFSGHQPAHAALLSFSRGRGAQGHRPPPFPRACGRILHLPQPAGRRARSAGGRRAHPRLPARHGRADRPCGRPLGDGRIVAFPKSCRWWRPRKTARRCARCFWKRSKGRLTKSPPCARVEGEALQKDLERPRRRLGEDRRRHRRARAADAHRLPRAPARQRGRAARRPDGRSAPCAGSGDHGRPPGHRRGTGAP